MNCPYVKSHNNEEENRGKRRSMENPRKQGCKWQILSHKSVYGVKTLFILLVVISLLFIPFVLSSCSGTRGGRFVSE